MNAYTDSHIHNNYCACKECILQLHFACTYYLCSPNCKLCMLGEFCLPCWSFPSLKMVRLLSTITQHQDGITTTSSPFAIETPTQAQYQQTGDSQGPLTQRRKSERKSLRMGRTKEGSSRLVLRQPLQLYSSSAPIKEGLVEKKGQATGWFFWPRFVATLQSGI